MPEPVAISELAGGDIDAVQPQLLVLYRACFSGPPWSETEDDVVAYGARVRGWAQLDSFAGLLAHDPGGTLVGASYGWRGPAEAHGIPLPGAPAGLPFHVADLMVHPDARRRGLGRLLLDRLVAGRRPALLLTHPASGSRHLYAAAGWRVTGTVQLPNEELLVFALD